MWHARFIFYVAEPIFPTPVQAHAVTEAVCPLRREIIVLNVFKPLFAARSRDWWAGDASINRKRIGDQKYW